MYMALKCTIEYFFVQKNIIFRVKLILLFDKILVYEYSNNPVDKSNGNQTTQM